MNSKHLARVRLADAAAVIVLANRTAKDPDIEDAGNILRVIALKNFSGKCKIIIQLLSFHNKHFLLNIVNWNCSQDTAICINELKLGILAQSALAPGFSTLLSNFFTMFEFSEKVYILILLKMFSRTPTYASQCGSNSFSVKEILVKERKNWKIYIVPKNDYKI